MIYNTARIGTIILISILRNRVRHFSDQRSGVRYLIQIDDAGSGSLVGGTYIGLMRVETGEYYTGLIPVKLYREECFKKKLYLDCAAEIVKEGLDVLQPLDREEIAICRGYMFDAAREHLAERNIRYVSSVIGNPLQTSIERSFQEYAISIGLPREFIKFTKYPFHFHRLLRWVYADYGSRIKLGKTGWNSWKKYGCLDLSVYNDFLCSSSYLCLKCGSRIYDNSRVKVIKYVSNMPNTIYLHRRCPE